jgi:hypothetical protein
MNAPPRSGGETQAVNLAVALELAEAGVSIFPARVSWGGRSGKWQKQPLVKRWQKAATTDRVQIKAWFEKHPNAVPGIELGRAKLIVTTRIATVGRTVLRQWTRSPRSMGICPFARSPIPQAADCISFSNNHSVRRSEIEKDNCHLASMYEVPEVGSSRQARFGLMVQCGRQPRTHRCLRKHSKLERSR